MQKTSAMLHIFTYMHLLVEHIFTLYKLMNEIQRDIHV